MRRGNPGLDSQGSARLLRGCAPTVPVVHLASVPRLDCAARTDAVQDLRRGRSQLKAFLLRNGYRYSGKSAWTEAHRRYLRELVLPHGAQRVVLEDSVRAITTAEERIQRLEDQMEALLESWPMKPVVEALMGLRGFDSVAAFGSFTLPLRFRAVAALQSVLRRPGARLKSSAGWCW